MESIKELECENFEVFKLSTLSATERYILKPKRNFEKTKRVIDPDFFLVERSFRDTINGVSLGEIVLERKLELLKK